MYSKEELAQLAGNAKNCGEFEADTATAADPGTNNAGLFQRLINLNPASDAKKLSAFTRTQISAKE